MSKLFTIGFFVLCIWIFTIILSYNFSFSRNYFRVNSDSEFLERFYFYRKTSEKAIFDLKKWLDKNNKTKKLFQRNNNNSICVGIVSKERLGHPNIQPNTIIPSIASLATRIKFKYENKVNIIVLNVDQNKKREDLMALSDLIEIVDLENPISPLRFEAQHPKVKEMSDYAFILKWLHKRSCAYVLLLEDDAIASYNWYEKTIDAITKLNSYTKNWFCLKLFTGFSQFDWIFDIDSVIRTILFVIMFAVAQCLFLNYLINILNKQEWSFNQELFQTRAFLSLKHIPKKYIFCIVLHTILFKLYLNCTSSYPFGHGVREFVQGFNLVATVYPNTHLQPIAKYLDTYLENFFDRKITTFIPD